MKKEWNERFYREQMTGKGMERIRIREEESDLLLFLSQRIDEKDVVQILRELRKELQEYITYDPRFLTSLVPIPLDHHSSRELEPLLKKMEQAAYKADVGPMAAVAGAIAEELGLALQEKYPELEVMIENGGDIYLSVNEEWTVGVFAGEHPLSGILKFRVPKEMMPLGICTSAGTVGPSLSFGKADAVVVLSKDTALADAVATATGNLVSVKEDIQKGIDFAKNIEGVLGVLIVVEDGIGAWGGIELVL